MVISYGKIQTCLKSLAQIILCQSLKAFKISFILGSKTAYFSASSALAPLVGFYASSNAAIIVFALRIMFHCIGFGISTAAFFYHIPTLFSTVYLAQKSMLSKVIIPTVCIALFLLHPVGWQVGCYALYWVVPILVALVSSTSIFLRSLASTLVAHAIGTLLWLYAGLLSAETILALASIVWLERLVFALLLTAGYHVVTFTVQHAHSFKKAFARNLRLEQA